MQSKLLIIFAAFIAFVAANQAISVIPLTSGQVYTGNLPANNIDYFVQVFSFYVWPNTTYYNFTVVNLNDTFDSDCEYVEGLYRNDGAPCYESYPTENWYCSNVYGDISTVSQAFFPGYRYSGSEFKTGTTVYFGVARYYSENAACPYTITVDQVAGCPAGQLPTTSELDDFSYTSVCSPATTVASSGTSNFNISGPAVTDAFSLYSIQVPLRTGSISITMNITDEEASIYGNQYSAVGYSDSAKCSTSSGEGEGPYFLYTLTCYTPREGLFVIAVQDSNAFNGTISFTVNACPTGLGGYNCLFPETALNISSSAAMSVYFPYNNTFTYYNQLIYYVDIPANYTGPDVIATFYSPQDDSAELGIRVNGYPMTINDGQEIDTISINNEGTQFGLSQFDFVFAGRYYFTLFCVDSDGCNVTMSFNQSSISTTSSSSGPVMTTGSSGASGSTTGITTGSTTGSTTSRTTAAPVTTSSVTTSAITTRGATTAVVTTGGVTPAVTTAAEKSGFEVIIPSVVLLLIALIF